MERKMTLKSDIKYLFNPVNMVKKRRQIMLTIKISIWLQMYFVPPIILERRNPIKVVIIPEVYQQ